MRLIDEKSRVRRGEEGLVSIMVVTIMIVVLALITIGFSRIMDRELRQSLDRELSSQAYYAAEAGLNDARAYVNDVNSGAAPAPASPNSCLNTAGLSEFAANGDISGDNLVKYTCVLVNMEPKELIYAPIPAGQTRVFKTNAVGLTNLYFSWENARYDNSGPLPLGNLGDLPQENAIGYDATGVLRATIYPVYGAAHGYGSDPNPKLAADSRTYFFYPNGGSGIGTRNYGQNGVFVPGDCSTNYPTLPYAQATNRYCNSEITGLPTIGDAASPDPAQQYYVRLTALYRDLSVSIQGTDPGNVAQGLPQAEAVADVTGEGNDVLHRISARIPFDSSFAFPNDSVNSMDTVCKRFRLPKTGPGPTDYASPVIDDPSGSSFCPLDSTAGPHLEIDWVGITHPTFGSSPFRLPNLVISINGSTVYNQAANPTSMYGKCTSVSGNRAPADNKFEKDSECASGSVQIPLSSISGPIKEVQIWETNTAFTRLAPDPYCNISECAEKQLWVNGIVSPPGMTLVNKSKNSYGPRECDEWPGIGQFDLVGNYFILSSSSYPVKLDNAADPGIEPCDPYGP